MTIYSKIWKMKNAESLEELIGVLDDSSQELKEMGNCGVILEIKDDFYVLSTERKDVARKFKFKDAHILEYQLKENRKERLKKLREETVQEMRKSVEMMRKIRFTRK